MTTSEAERMAADGRRNAGQVIDRTVETLGSTAQNLAAKAATFGDVAAGGLRSGVDIAAERLPGLVEEGATASRGAYQSLRELPDDRLLLVATFSVGVGVGLWLAGAPRLVTLAAFSPAIVMGLASASRSGGAGAARRRNR